MAVLAALIAGALLTALALAIALLGLGDFPGARSLIGPILARPRNEEMRERARTLLGQISRLQQQR